MNVRNAHASVANVFVLNGDAVSLKFARTIFVGEEINTCVSPMTDGLYAVAAVCQQRLKNLTKKRLCIPGHQRCRTGCAKPVNQCI